MADFSKIRVELRRHVGVMYSTEFGMMEIEHDQKIVLYSIPDPLPGESPTRQAGYLPDAEDSVLLWLPHIREKAEQVPGLVEWIESEAYRIKAEGNDAK